MLFLKASGLPVGGMTPHIELSISQRVERSGRGGESSSMIHQVENPESVVHKDT